MPSVLPVLIDCHNHLQDSRLAGRAGQILEECTEHGVRECVVNGTSESDWPRVSELARRFPGQVRASYGLHPWYVRERTASWKATLEGFLDGGACGVGEAGLDRWIAGHDPVDQSEVLAVQIAMARARELPLTLHCLRAWGAMRQQLEQSALPSPGFLLHSYGGPPEFVPVFVQLGGYFSFSGHFLRPDKQGKLESFRRVPLDRLLIESDAPDMRLPPELETIPLAGPDGAALNHPANLPAVLEGLARLREIPGKELAERVEANYHRLFGGAKASTASVNKLG